MTPEAPAATEAPSVVCALAVTVVSGVADQINDASTTGPPKFRRRGST